MVNEKKFYIAILIVVIIYLILSFFLPVDPFSKRITTVTALISAVAFWLQFKRTERLNESNFIMNLNNQFIGNKDMTLVEHELELYYNQFEVHFADQKKVSAEEVAIIHLGLSQSRTSDECQKLINYLVYLESLAALVGRKVIHLDVIDDLFSYRFFLAVNNPVVQFGELFPYSDFYQGIYTLSEKWIKNHREKGIPIPMEQFCLTRERLETWKANPPSANLDISIAGGDDKKIEIARCIYDTDRYIYPEAFGEDREKAAKAISRLIGMDNSLFDYKNLLLARYNGEVCGICLISDGSATWDIETIQKRIRGELPSKEAFEHASKHYFSTFGKIHSEENMIELVACCVNEGFRRKHIAHSMLEELIRMYKGKTIKLDVLCDNESAIALYKKVGFSIIGEAFPGYAPEGLQRPMCYTMQKKN